MTKATKNKHRKMKVVYELECWVRKGKNGEINIHHTNNGGFPAPGQIGNFLYVNPAKLVVYESPYQALTNDTKK